MKKIMILFLISALFTTMTINSKEKKKSRSQIYKEVRNMKIKDIDLTDVTDDIYKGSYSYSGVTHDVEVEVKDHKIITVNILKGAVTKQGKKAEKIVDDIIAEQTPNVDTISGATTTSKAILKAIENAFIAEQMEEAVTE